MDFADMPRHRPMAFDKMENLLKEMQDSETGVPVGSQKTFLTHIPSAFMGYDLIEWLMERLDLEESVEALNMANQFCQYGYFFPVNDTKNLTIKDDSSLYRFQSAYYWPWQQRASGGSGSGAAGGVGGGGGAALGSADSVEYAIYLCKRTLRNKQRHGLDEHELEALANLRKNLQAKWDFITMQAQEQVRLAKDRKKGDKIVSDSQERAYWRVCRPPPGATSALDACPFPARQRHNAKPKRRTIEQVKKEVEMLRASVERTRVKASAALEAMFAYADTFTPWDAWLTPVQPANPWLADDPTYWQINDTIVDVPTEKRAQRWALSMEELLADETGLREFTSFLRKEYSHENIRFYRAVTDLRRSAQRHIQRKLNDIYDEFLKPGAPCEINIDGATMERVQAELRTPSRFALDAAADHVYALLLKKDCYPRFVRSDHYRNILAAGRQTQQKKRFFGFGPPKKKPTTSGSSASSAGATGRTRRGSDRSLSGSAHELAVSGVAAPPLRVPHSHSQSNLTELPYTRDPINDDNAATPWEDAAPRRRKDSATESGSSSSDLNVSGLSGTERARRVLPQQSTLDGGLRGAPPPLRRLSAVEPRHLAPLCDATPGVLHPRDRPLAKSLSINTPSLPSASTSVAPTISIISAPEDDEFDDSSAEAHPSDSVDVPIEHCLAEMSISEENISASAADTPSDSDVVAQDGRVVLGAEPKVATTNEHSSVRASPPATFPDVIASASEASGEGLASVSSAVVDEVFETVIPSMAVEVSPSPTINMIPPTPPAALSDVATSLAPMDPYCEQTTTQTRPAPTQIAPLAESEDICVDDDNLHSDIVPCVLSLPDQEGPIAELSPCEGVAGEPTAVEESTTVTAAAATATAASVQQAECATNDVCPWEDEDTCKADAPFVKTYATLGYL